MGRWHAWRWVLVWLREHCCEEGMLGTWALACRRGAQPRAQQLGLAELFSLAVRRDGHYSAEHNGHAGAGERKGTRTVA